MENYGYAGKILFVDLSSGNIREEPLDTGLAEKFVGGPGIGYELLCDFLKPDTDPFLCHQKILSGGKMSTGCLMTTMRRGVGML